MCEAGSIPRIVSRGNGTPGKCCDVFECVNGKWIFFFTLLFNGKNEWTRGKQFHLSAIFFLQKRLLSQIKRYMKDTSGLFNILKGLQVDWIFLINSLRKDYSIHLDYTSIK